MKKLIGLIILSSLLSFPLFAKGNKTFERNISIAEGPVFMPKGEFIFGGTVSYNSFNFDDFDFQKLTAYISTLPEAEQQQYNGYIYKLKSIKISIECSQILNSIVLISEVLCKI